MKTLNITVLIAILIFAACKSKKSTSAGTSTNANSTTSTSTSTTSANVPAGPVMMSKSADGVFEPGNEELTAIQAQYKDVTMEKLKQGYELYAITTCIGCHNAKSIYKRDVNRWQFIIDDMAERSRLTDIEKDAVFKYVLAIKATQIK